MLPRFEELRVDEHGFIEFLKRSFAQKRKMLANNLHGYFSPAGIRQSLEQAGIEPRVRAEAVALDRMAALYRILTESAKVDSPRGE